MSKKKNINIDQNSVKVLVAPLDWGLGHATRCIPIIKELLEEGCQVLVAGPDSIKSVILEEFPTLKFLPLRGYRISLARKTDWFLGKILFQFPKIFNTLSYEKKWLNRTIKAENIDTINGHLTATSKDSLEIENWTRALNRKGSDFPYINSLKSMVGHCLAAAGSIESVATVLQLKEQFIFPNINCNDVHPEIMELIAENKIPKKMIKKELNIAAKASFGFGDVNACIIFKRYN